jgi:hypothetical protein
MGMYYIARFKRRLVLSFSLLDEELSWTTLVLSLPSFFYLNSVYGLMLGTA